MAIKYHAPSKGFLISYNDLQSTADSVIATMRTIRMGAGLPLVASTSDPSTEKDNHAKHALLELMRHASELGIDLGADRWYKLDVREQ